MEKVVTTSQFTRLDYSNHTKIIIVSYKSFRVRPPLVWNFPLTVSDKFLMFRMTEGE